jgi:hypothetical protein
MNPWFPIVVCFVAVQNLVSAGQIDTLTSAGSLKSAGIEVSVKKGSRNDISARSITISWTPSGRMRSLGDLQIRVDILQIVTPPDVKKQREGRYTLLSSTRHFVGAQERTTLEIIIPNPENKDVMVLLGKVGEFMFEFDLNNYLSTNAEEKAEQTGADQPATKPADKTPVKDQPPAPSSKVGPR